MSIKSISTKIDMAADLVGLTYPHANRGVTLAGPVIVL